MATMDQFRKEGIEFQTESDRLKNRANFVRAIDETLMDGYVTPKEAWDLVTRYDLERSAIIRSANSRLRELGVALNVEIRPGGYRGADVEKIRTSLLETAKNYAPVSESAFRPTLPTESNFRAESVVPAFAPRNDSYPNSAMRRAAATRISAESSANRSGALRAGEAETSASPLANAAARAERAYDSVKNGLSGLLSGIRSLPMKRSETGSTLCAQTARENASRFFGVDLPRGHAIVAQRSYSRSGERKAKNASAPVEVVTRLPNDPENGVNFADVFTSSKNVHGHRCVAFHANEQWFLLDPYMRLEGGKTTRDPIPLSRYPWKHNIRLAALYKLPEGSERVA